MITLLLLWKYKTDFLLLPQCFTATNSAKLRCHVFFSSFPKHTNCGCKRPHAFFCHEYLFRRCGVQRCSEIFFRNLLQGGDGTSTKKLDEDLDILWASKGGNVDLSKWSKDNFSTGLIPDYIDCKYFAGKPMATNNFGLCFAAKEKCR